MQNPALDDTRLLQLEEAASELEGVSEIFNTVLRISKIAASHDSENFTVFPVGPFLQEIDDLFEPIGESGGQTLPCTIDETASGSAGAETTNQSVRGRAGGAAQVGPPRY